MGRRRSAAAAPVAALFLLASVFVAPAGALFKATCDPAVGPSHADPIVHHNEAVDPGDHLHVFFGNRAILQAGNLNSSNYGDLVGDPNVADIQETSCVKVAGDTAAYWIPMLYVNGQPFAPNAVKEYYRSWDHDGDNVADPDTEPFPRDVRLIAGNSQATGPQPLNIVDWSCDDRSNKPGPYHSPAEADCRTAQPDPGAGGVIRLTLHVTFPSCWNGRLPNHTAGENGDTRDSADFAYRQGNACPAGFPRKVPTIIQTYWWGQREVWSANPSDITLSSGSAFTAHADFWNTWEQPKLAGLVSTCINQPDQGASACGF